MIRRDRIELRQRVRALHATRVPEVDHELLAGTQLTDRAARARLLGDVED